MSDTPHEPVAEGREPEKLPPVKAIQKTVFWQELITATRYLTRLRIPLRRQLDPYLVGRSLAWFPLIGALIGAFGALLESGFGAIGLPSTVTATLAVMGMLWLTRALHEEELANFVNHYGHVGDKQRRQNWLGEERTVPYGMLGVFLFIILKISCISTLNSSHLVFIALIIAGAWSRAAMVVAASWLKPQPDDAVAGYFGHVSGNRVIWAVVIAVLAAVLVLWKDVGFVLATAALATLAIIGVGARLQGGQYNGPLLGGIQQVVEITVICAIVATQ